MPEAHKPEPLDKPNQPSMFNERTFACGDSTTLEPKSFHGAALEIPLPAYKDVVPAVDLIDYYRSIATAVRLSSEINSREGYERRYSGQGVEPQEKVEGSSEKIPELKEQRLRAFQKGWGLAAMQAYFCEYDAHSEETVALEEIRTRYYLSSLVDRYSRTGLVKGEQNKQEKRRKQYMGSLEEGIKVQHEMRGSLPKTKSFS